MMAVMKNQSSKNPEKVDDMLDIIEINGQPALSIDGAIIGTQEEIIQHLRKSEGYDELTQMIREEEAIFNKDGDQQ